MDELLIGAKIKWVGDRIATLATIAPRHIGRVVKFEYFDTDVSSYDYISVMGTLESYAGQVIGVSGEYYDWSRVGDFTVFRKELA